MAVQAGGFLQNMQEAAQAANNQTGYGVRPPSAAPPMPQNPQFPGQGFNAAPPPMNGQPNNNAQPINIAIGQILAQTLQNLSQQPGAMEQVGAAGGAAMAEMVSAFARSLAGSSSVMARQLAEQVPNNVPCYFVGVQEGEYFPSPQLICSQRGR
jgi:hypothetical protein